MLTVIICRSCRQASTEEGGSPQGQQSEGHTEVPENQKEVAQEADHPSPLGAPPSPLQEDNENAKGGVVGHVLRKRTPSTTV